RFVRERIDERGSVAMRTAARPARAKTPSGRVRMARGPRRVYDGAMQAEPDGSAGEERFAQVGGYRIHYIVAGAGAPVVLVHGVGGSLHTYQRNVAALAQHDRVYAVDLPGHGYSAVPDVRYLAEEGGAFLVAFIEQVCGAPAA